jgi:hypothetical protein
MELQELREFWRSRWGFPPKLRAVVLLRHIIAWRLQAAHFGGLDSATARLLASSLPLTRAMPPSGSRLRREYGGVIHEVEVLEAGFRYAGKDFNTLTAVAEAITGTHYPGPRFFGLRPRSAQT